MQLKVKLPDEYPREMCPSYETEGSAGFDLRSYEDVIIPAGSRKLVSTGLKVEVPVGCELQIRPRSGLALKKGITVLNTPGTIDSDYRGVIGVILFNTSDEDFIIYKWDRIAQAVLSPFYKADFEFVDKLSDTDRGEGGFGHTGI